MGTIKCNSNYNGGILGGTYNLYDETNTSTTKNSIIGCYNMGEIESISPNQISPKYARVNYSYYISKSTNTSGYGTGKTKERFQTTDRNSVLFGIQLVTPGYWAINDKNNGYLSLTWQNE